MIRLLVRILLVLPLLLLLLLASGAWWVLESERGTRWLWQRVDGLVPGELSAVSIDGALSDGMSARNVRYVSDVVEVTVSSARLTTTPTIFPLAVDLADVDVGEVTVRLRRAPMPDPRSPGPSVSDILPMLELPLRVRVDGFSLEQLRVIGHDRRQRFAMRDVRFSGGLDERLALESARLDIGALHLQATGSVGLAVPNPVDATVRLLIDADAAAFLHDTPVALAATLRGDLDELQVEVGGESPQFHLAGMVRDVARARRWDVEVESDAFQWPPGAADPLVRARAIDLASDGSLEGYTLHGSATVEIRDSGALAATMRATGDTTGLDVADLALDGEAATAALRGRLGWSPSFSIETVADVMRFEMHRFVPAWPEDRAVSGAVDARLRPGSIELAELSARVENSTMALDSTGTIDTGRGIVDLDLEWQDAQWPLDAEQPQVRSDSGAVRLAGAPDDWEVDGRILLGVAGYPEGTFVLRGAGDREHAAVSLAESEVLGGTVSGNLRYDWQAGGSWSASLTADDVHTAPVLSAWPGVLDAKFEAAGRVRPLAFELNLQRFDGSMRGMPVAGGGGLRYAPGELRFRDFEIESGESSLVVDGMLRSAEGIDFQVDIDGLGTFLRPATGSLAARGNVAMPDGFPRLTLDLDGRDLGWRQYRAATLAIDTVEQAEAPIALQVNGSQVELGGRVLESVDALLTAGPDAQRLRAELVSADSRLAAVLDGALADWRKPLTGGWRGRLESLDLTAGPGFTLALSEPAPLRLAPDEVALENFCLAGDASLSICGDGHWAGARDFRARVELTAFPVDAFRLAFDTGLEFTQTLDGSMTFSRTAERELSGDVELGISAGRIRNRIDERLATTTRPGALEMKLENGQFLSGRMQLPFSEASEIDAQFEVLDVARGEASPVDGQLRLQVNDIGIAASVMPMITAASGRLTADVVLAGTVGEPSLTGEGSLSGGRLAYEPLGLQLEDLQLRGNIREDNRLELQGTFRAGAGSGRLYTSADYLDGAQTGLRVALSGQNLTVVNVPNLMIVANPELGFGLDDGTITVNGSIVVPQARLSPANLTANTVRESEDVVVVAGQEEAVEETPEEGNGIALRGEVDLTLGDDIVIDLDIADAQVTGATTFRWSGPPMPTADGQYLVSGNFQAYGQLLQITEGIVNFPKVPADNPVLRIRAEREIFGNSQIRSAGVFISGTAKDPDVEVYTNPATTESRALTLLVTGSDFNYDQGVGGVDVGTYIAPDLYLSYGIGLFERENVISLRYDIAKGFGIKASSSARTDGIDLSYTIER